MSRVLKHSIFFVVLLLSTFAIAFPLSEKTPDTETAPLDILSSQPDDIIVPTFGDFQGEIMFSLDASTFVTLIDLETWEENSVQPDEFLSTVVDVTVLENGTSVILALSDGNIARIELDDENTFINTDAEETSEEEEEEEDAADSRQIDIADKMTTAGIDFIVSDPTDEIVYMVNSSNLFFKYNITTNSLTELSIEDEETSTTTSEDDTFDTTEETTTTTFTPTGLVFANADSGKKILMITTTGNVLVISTDAGSFTTVTVDASDFDNTEPNFADIALTADNEYAFIVDSDNDLIWVFSVNSEDFVAQQSSGTQPIEVDTSANTTFTHVVLYEDPDGTEVAYVSGAEGITVIDADDPGTSSSSTKVIGVDGTDEDPIALSSTPGPLATTGGDIGYLFSANGNATISVITDNPWISITSIDPNEVTEDAPSFTVTFQSDTAGDYTMRVNSDPTGTDGTELIGSTSFTAVDTDMTTASVDINDFERSTFIEGDNKIFILVTDPSGNIGHTAILLNVDRPPEPINITGVNFGNQKAFVDFDESPDEDIASYTIFAEPAEDQTNPTCPGSLTFDSTSTVSGEITPDVCENETCEATIQPLTNDVTYCVAVIATDEAGNKSIIATFTTPVTPEQTVGPAGFLGETNLFKCSLNQNSKPNSSPYNWLIFLTPLLLLLVKRFAKSPIRQVAKSILIYTTSITLLLTFIAPSTAHAEERTPQNWTLEVKAHMWIPTDSAVKNFVGTCCNFGGEIEFGWLYRNRYNFTMTTGIGVITGNAVGVSSGAASGDKYTLLMFPVRFDFIYRFDFKSEQLFLPYVRVGGDAVIFKETAGGTSTSNIKFGFHGGAGLGILLDKAEGMGSQLEDEIGINDVYLIIEGRYAMINSFKSTGLDLSGFYPYLGVLFEF